MVREKIGVSEIRAVGRVVNGVGESVVKEARKRVVEAAEAIGEIVEITGSLLTKNLENQFSSKNNQDLMFRMLGKFYLL